MTQLLNSLLTLLITYGYPVAAIGVAIGYTGIPIPQDVILIAAGSLTSDGGLNLPLLILILASTAILGDVVAYLLGRKLGMAFFQKHGHKVRLQENHLKSLDNFLHKWGVLAIFSTRWLITPLGIPISILAGVSKYTFLPYLVIVAVGELLWVSIFTILGNIFGANWQALVSYTQDIPTIALFLTIGIVLIYMGFKYKNKSN